jgi:hypothetical protein
MNTISFAKWRYLLLVIVLFFGLASIIASTGVLRDLSVADTFVLAVNDFNRAEPALPGHLIIFTSTLADRSTWTKHDSIPHPLHLGSGPSPSYQPRPHTRPFVWAARSATASPKFVVFYWDQHLPSLDPNAGDESRLVAATFSDEFGWTMSQAGRSPVLTFFFGALQKKAFSPAAAELQGEFVVAWGGLPSRRLWEDYSIQIAKLSVVRQDADPNWPGQDINRYDLVETHGALIEPGFRTGDPVTLLAHEGKYVLGFKLVGSSPRGNPADYGRFVVSTSTDGVTWTDPAVSSVPELLPYQAGVPVANKRIHALIDVWGLTWVRRVGGDIDLTTVGRRSSGTSTSSQEDVLLRFRATNDLLTTYTSPEMTKNMPASTRGFVIAGGLEWVDAFLHATGSLRGRAYDDDPTGPGFTAITFPAAAPGLTRTAPSIAFGHSPQTP